MSWGVNLFELIQNYGLKGLVIFVLLSLIGSIFKPQFLSKIIDYVAKFFKKKSKDQLVTESNIKNHDIFTYIDFWVRSKIPTIEFSTGFRNKVFKRYLTIFLEEYKNGILEFINDDKYKSMDESELWKEFLSMINDIVSSYERRCAESGIPNVVIHKMKAKNNDTIKLMLDLVGNISRSDFYQSEDNYLKLYSILNIILSILENTINNSAQVCDSINGELRGLEFEGEKEP